MQRHPVADFASASPLLVCGAVLVGAAIEAGWATAIAYVGWLVACDLAYTAWMNTRRDRTSGRIVFFLAGCILSAVVMFMLRR